MLFKIMSVSALSVVALLAQISTQSSIHHRRARALYSDKSDSAFKVRRDVSQAELSQLQSEYTMFKGWMNAILSAGTPSDQSVAQPTPVFNAGTASAGTAGTAAPTMPATSPAASTPTGTAPASPPFPANSSTPAAAAAPTGTGSAGSGGFLQAVYYGSSADTSQVPLSQICAGNTVDIVILAFLSTFDGPGGYPKVDFGGACPAAAIPGSSATGLLNCPALAANITDCQKAGKKVFLSIGGQMGSVDIASAADASTYATNVWNIFGGGKSTVGRPFGDVKLDGFDIGKWLA